MGGWRVKREGYAFSYCSWGYQGKNTEVVCHSLLQWTTFCQTSPPRPGHLGWPHMSWLSFIELDKAVVHASGPSTSWQTDGETVETVAGFILGSPKSL